jgi:FMN phosphatase YigB (HAD superfamily)
MGQFNQHTGGVHYTPAERAEARRELGYDPYGHYNQHTGQVEYSPAQQVQQRQAETAEAARIQRRDRDEDPETFDSEEADELELKRAWIQVHFTLEYKDVPALNAYLAALGRAGCQLEAANFDDDDKETAYQVLIALYYHAVEQGQKLLEAGRD